jgi:UDP-glucose 4-epimerase
LTTLVTGGAGFIGSNVVRRLLKSSEEAVVVLDIRGKPADPGSPLHDLGDRVKYILGTVTDLSLVLRTLSTYNVDGVIHIPSIVGRQADLRPVEALEVNVMGTVNVLESARLAQLRRVLIVSSSAVMGDPSDTVTPRREEEIILPSTGIYSVSKLTVEMLTHTYREVYEVDAVAIRPRTVYGPGARPSPMPVKSIVEAACRGEAVVLDHGADTQFDLTYAKDLARGLVAAFHAVDPLPRYVYNLSYGTNISLGSVAQAIRAALPDASIQLGDGVWRNAQASSPELHEVPPSRTRPPQDNSRALADFGYHPVWPIERAMPDYIRWIRYRDYGSLD